MSKAIDNLWMSFIVIASAGVGVKSCEIPQNLNNYLHFSNESTENVKLLYMVSCVDHSLTVSPIWGSSSYVRCKDNAWLQGYTGRTPIDLSSLKCIHTCTEPQLANGQVKIDDQFIQQNNHKGLISKQHGSERFYIPGVQFNLHCVHNFSLSSKKAYTITCGSDGLWAPSMPTCVSGETTTKSIEEGVSPDPNRAIVITITVVVVAVVSCVVIMVTIAARAKWRGACRKRRAPTSHPDDVNYPHGYTQLESGPGLPSYAEATEDNEDGYGGSHLTGVYSVYRPTTTADYRQLSSIESSSRGESESLSAGSHRHSLFSGSSSNYRTANVGDNISDILLQGDHLSMSDTSTLVTVNTYESSHTASNPSLTNSRRGVAGSMVSNTATSLDDAPLIVRRFDDAVEDNPTNNADC